MATAAPFPPDEEARLDALHRFAILDTPYDPRFDRLVKLAAHIFGTTGAMVSLVDSDRIWFKSHIGIDVREVPREHGFCSWAILQDEVCVVEDASMDDRFADNPYVQGGGLRFYAGAPLVGMEGQRIGTLYRTLVVDFAMIKLHLTGIAAHRGELTPETAVELVQCYTKNYEFVSSYRVDFLLELAAAGRDSFEDILLLITN